MARGRKRKLRVRYACGKIRPTPEELERRMAQRNETVEPTPEISAQREAAFGDAKATGELCCPLDRLRHRLTEEQYWAGRYARTIYARYCIAIGMPRLVAGQLMDYIQGGGTMPMGEEQAQAAVQEYLAAITAIRRYSRRSLIDVQRVMHGSPPRNVPVLITGLTALADFMGLKARTVA